MKQEFKALTLLLVLLLLSLTVLGCQKRTAIENTPTAVVTDSTATDSVTSTASVTATATKSAAPLVTEAPTAAQTTNNGTDSPAKTPAPTPRKVSAAQWQATEITFNSSFGDTAVLNSGAVSTFESSSLPSGWTAFSGGKLSTSTTIAHSGSRSLCFTGRNDAWTSPAFNVYDLLKVGGAGNYNISFWVYADALPAGSSTGRVLVRGTSADANSFIKNSNGNYFAAISSNILTAEKTWVNYSATINLQAKDITRASGTFNIVIDSLGVSSGQKLYFDDFTIKKAHYKSSFGDVQLDVTFTGPDNTKLVVPAFWDGGSVWKVRFAPTKVGTWTFKTICSDTGNRGLHNITGTVNATAYKGSLDIYKHGFIKISSNSRYFTYADGTPFFYLGDTHWGMIREELDSSTVAGIASHFKYIVDKRAQQGFTVYQSEPIGAGYSLSNGLGQDDIKGFTDLDRRFAYIAEKGLVHANAELFYSSELSTYPEVYTDKYLEKLCRYWVARYSAYPVMWTTAQECDNDSYYVRGDQNVYDADATPWKKVAAWVHKYDPYAQPLTAHMEYASMDSVHGVNATNSSFKHVSGHNWYAVQWSPSKSAQATFAIPKDFWNSDVRKPIVNYEGCYDRLWTKEFGARAQGWNAYLNGMYGYGYGAIDIWLYNSTYNADVDTKRDGDIITVAEKDIKWNVSVEFATAYQVGYMRSFLSKIEWWNLTPRFDDTNYFTNSGSFYTVASKGNDLYVAYFYNATQKTGTLKGLANVTYTAQWFNPRTNAYGTVSSFTPANGIYAIGNKPDTGDWVLIVKKK